MSTGTPAKSTGAKLYRALEAGWPGAIAYAALGALVLRLYGLVAPSGYRAEAVVLVHHNVERVVVDPSSDEAAGYIDRETAALEGLSYADAVWDVVARELAVEGWIRSPGEMERLLQAVRLPHPKDGEWRFTANTADPALSARLADAWAEAFVAEANRAVSAAVTQDSLAQRIREETTAVVEAQTECADLDSAADELAEVDAGLREAGPTQAALEAEGLLLMRLATRIGAAGTILEAATVADQIALAEALSRGLAILRETCQSESDRLEAQLESHRSEAAALAASEMGLSPLLEVALLRQAHIPSAPVARPEATLGAGAIVGMCVWLLRVLMRTREGAGGQGTS